MFEKQEAFDPFSVVLYPKDRLTNKFKKPIDQTFVRKMKTVDQVEREQIMRGLEMLQSRDCKEKINKYREDLSKLKVN